MDKSKNDKLTIADLECIYPAPDRQYLLALKNVYLNGNTIFYSEQSLILHWGILSSESRPLPITQRGISYLKPHEIIILQADGTVFDPSISAYDRVGDTVAIRKAIVLPSWRTHGSLYEWYELAKKEATLPTDNVVSVGRLAKC